jgi:dinuclear metal center YbgI/SA1388 family protein
MATVQHVLDALEVVAPARLAFGFDKIGLQVGDPNQKVAKAVVCLDWTRASVAFAKQHGAQLILAHHPLIFNPISSVDTRSHQGRVITEMIQADLSFIAAHTNWDCAKGGINDALAAILGLQDVRPFGEAANVSAFKVAVTCPLGSEDVILDAASAAGAGSFGAYRRCAFTGPGTGTFEPLQGANPAVGEIGEREVLPEARIEMFVLAEDRRKVDRAIRQAHPYEEPAIDWYVLADFKEQPAGRIGRISPTPLAEFIAFTERCLNTKCWVWGQAREAIKTVALTGGAAENEWRAARNAGADLFITGEVRQHIAAEASESGLSIMAAGHFATENPGCKVLRDRMSGALPEIEWLFFEPEPGTSGRPM